MEKFAPQPPRWLINPEPVKIRIEGIVDSLFDEVLVTIKIGEKEISAWVPENSVVGSTVRGVKLAEKDDRVMVAMPVSTITHPHLWIPKALETEVLVA